MRCWFTILLGISSTTLFAQTDTYGGLFPEMALSKIQGNWKYTLKIESQNYFYSSPALDQWKYTKKQNDLQGFIAHKITPLASLSVGYQYRMTNSEDNSHRLIEQLSFVQKSSLLRVGHRIRLDQTFLDEGLQLRFRYRLSLEIPLNGHSLDPKEFYLLAQDEPIMSFEPEKQDLENRLNTAIGYVFRNHSKIQSGIDYRTDRYFIAGFRHRIWWKTGLYLKI